MQQTPNGEWFDLTLPVRPGMPVYPGDPPVAFLSHNALADDGFAVTAVRLGTHSGTHVDAPAHFLASGRTVDETPLTALVGPARVVDLGDLGHGEEIGPEQLGRLSLGDRLLLRSGWSGQYDTPAYYEAFPSLARGTVRKLATAGVALIGLETPSLCAEACADAAAHRELLEAGVVIIEGLTGLASLPNRAWLIALPLPLVGLDGSPCRVIARGR
jgi:kynurenine formamidase